MNFPIYCNTIYLSTSIKDAISKVRDKAIEDDPGRDWPRGSTIIVTTDWGYYFKVEWGIQWLRIGQVNIDQEDLQLWLHQLWILICQMVRSMLKMVQIDLDQEDPQSCDFIECTKVNDQGCLKLLCCNLHTIYPIHFQNAGINKICESKWTFSWSKLCTVPRSRKSMPKDVIIDSGSGSFHNQGKHHRANRITIRK